MVGRARASVRAFSFVRLRLLGCGFCWKKGSGGWGGMECFGILRCAQDDGKSEGTTQGSLGCGFCWKKGSGGWGGMECFGILRCAQDHSKSEGTRQGSLGCGFYWQKGSGGWGGMECFGILRCAQDDSKSEGTRQSTSLRSGMAGGADCGEVRRDGRWLWRWRRWRRFRRGGCGARG